jgi:hypothetical protein
VECSPAAASEGLFSSSHHHACSGTVKADPL